MSKAESSTAVVTCSKLSLSRSRLWGRQRNVSISFFRYSCPRCRKTLSRLDVSPDFKMPSRKVKAENSLVSSRYCERYAGFIIGIYLNQ